MEIFKSLVSLKKQSTFGNATDGFPQIWVVTRHQYGISALVSQTSFGGETSGSITKCHLSSQAKLLFNGGCINWGQLKTTNKINRNCYRINKNENFWLHQIKKSQVFINPLKFPINPPLDLGLFISNTFKRGQGGGGGFIGMGDLFHLVKMVV